MCEDRHFYRYLWIPYSRGELFMRTPDDYFGVYFPRCETWKINTKLTLSWAHKQFATLVHSLWYTLYHPDECWEKSFDLVMTLGPRDLLSGEGVPSERSSRDVPAPDNKSLGCCCRTHGNSRPTVINPLNNTHKENRNRSYTYLIFFQLICSIITAFE